MDTSFHTESSTIRKIEDIIELQKAKGNFNVRQVAFNLPSDSISTTSTNVVKSLESGLDTEKTLRKQKHIRCKRSGSPLPDVLSWPSDSDITVLRMKLGLNQEDLKENLGGVVPGDGLHKPDNSSMVNLATLILQTQTTSKNNMAVEEYLLPLTSWERKQQQDCDKNWKTKIGSEEKNGLCPSIITYQADMHNTRCSHKKNDLYFCSRDSDCSNNTRRSKMARFLRLYFCPCCTCLYRLEKMQDGPSVCFTKGKGKENIHVL